MNINFIKFFNIFSNDDEKAKKPLIHIPIKTKMMLLLIVFISGFIFFITSNFWLVTSKDFTSNNIYDVISLSNDINLKLKRFSFNPETKETEVEIGKNITTATDNLKFNLTILSNGNTLIKPIVKYDSDSMWVISINKLPFGTKYLKLEFRVQIDDEEYLSYFIMDLKSKQIEIDNKLNSSNKDDTYYITKSISYEKETLEKTLIDNNKIIEDANKQIKDFNISIKEIQNNKPTNTTKEELDLLNTKINNINIEINNLNNLIQTKQEENKVLQHDIEVLTNKLNKK